MGIIARIRSVLLSAIRWLEWLEKVVSLPAKDPMDLRLTPNSTKWETETYCPNCKSETRHEERMADICNNCGHFGCMRNYRSYRKIFDGTKWVRQNKYGNGPKNYEIVEI